MASGISLPNISTFFCIGVMTKVKSCHASYGQQLWINESVV